jgi:hypothetical protein
MARQQGPSGVVRPNSNLGLTRAHHLVLAYELSTGKFSRLRIEPFYQKLFNVPVIPGTSFSMANLEMDWFFNDSLAGTGTGVNYGIDATWKSPNNGYYSGTLSLFDLKT